MNRKCVMMDNFGYRLSRQTGSKKTNMKVFSVYTAPIIDYYCPIWNANGSLHGKYIESIYRAITRNTRSTPRLPYLNGYEEYKDRIKALHTMTLKEKITLERIMTGFRIWRNELKTNVKHIFNEVRNVNIRTLRSPLLFNLSHIAENSTIYRIKDSMNLILMFYL